MYYSCACNTSCCIHSRYARNEVIIIIKCAKSVNLPLRLNDNSVERTRRISRGSFFTGLCFIESTSAVRGRSAPQRITAWIFAGSVSRGNAAPTLILARGINLLQRYIRTGNRIFIFTNWRDIALDSLSGRRSREPAKIR